MRYFTESHEWISVAEQQGKVGVTVHAQDQLGDIVYVELPEVGQQLQAGQEVAVLESTKAAADVYTPVSGIITAVNEALQEDPGLVNREAEQNGWLFAIELTDRDELKNLLTDADYQSLIG